MQMLPEKLESYSFPVIVERATSIDFHAVVCLFPSAETCNEAPA